MATVSQIREELRTLKKLQPDPTIRRIKQAK